MPTFARILFLAGLVASTHCHAEYKKTLTTRSYVITISVNCEEGTADCNNVDYVGVNRKNGRTIKLRGRDITHYCPGDQGDGPGKTPCHHLGFEFKSGLVTYQVWDYGKLEVWQYQGLKVDSPRKQLLDEQGTWNDE